MPSTIPRLKLFFLGLFFLGCIAVWAYQIFYIWPRDRCEAKQAWWDPQTRVCAAPIFLPKLTGRPIGSPPLKPAQPRVAPGVQSTSPAP